MSDTEPRPLPDDVQALLRQAPRPVPPAGFDAAVLARVKATLAAGSGGAAGPGAAGAVASKMGAWGLPVAVAALVVGAAGGALVGARVLAPQPSPAQQVAAPQGPLPPPPEPAAALPEPAEPPVPKQAPPPRRVAPPPSIATPPPSPPAPGRDVALSEERALIETARTSLARRQTQRAVATLEQHAREFPTGQLAEERESLWIQALVNLGRFAEARDRAALFETQFPDSMLLPAVEAALDSAPAGDGG